MLKLIVLWIFSSIGLLVTSKAVPGFNIKDFKSAMLISAVIGLLNILIRPILIIVTLPINILTLGLFTFVVNACILKITSQFVRSFEIASWWTAILAAVILAFLQVVLNFFIY